MKVALLLPLFVPFALAGTISPPNTIEIIRPDPKHPVPRSTALTIGYSEPSKLIFGLVQNVDISYTAPNGSLIHALSYGPPLESGGYSPQECRTYPGDSITATINPDAAGKCVTSILNHI